MTVIPLIFLILLFGKPPVPKTGDKEPQLFPPKPSVEISFERFNIRENDTVKLALIVINDADYDLTTTSLEVTSPAFLAWRVVSCNDQSFNPARDPSKKAPLVPVKARSTSRCNLEVATEANIAVGEFNSLFVLSYQRQVGKRSEASLVTTEKTLKASLFGSESVAGVPLVLAGFIVPGLIFWIIVGFLGASWKRDGLGDQMIFSVLVSLVLVTIGTWIGFVDLNAGISSGKLFRLGIGGLIAGVFAGGFDLAVRLIKKQRNLRDQINEGDDDLTLLAKLIKLPAHAIVAQPMIQLKSGKKYLGSIGARTEMIRRGSAEKTALFSLVGSWTITRPAGGSALRKEIDDLWQDGKIRRLIESAKQHNLINPEESLQELDASGTTMTPTSIGGQSWKAEEVQTITSNVSGWSSPPLDFK